MKNIINELENYGIKSRIIPVGCLSEIKEEMEELKRKVNLNGFQKWIINDQYVFDLPKVEFEIRSVIVTAARYKLVKAVFNYKGKRAYDIFCKSTMNMNETVSEALKKNGYHAEYNYWYPMKRLAVRSGLAEYGKNNITYIDDWGSFYGLSVFLSDAPCDEYTWRPVKNMDICNDCNICLNNCPTGAILSDRFLIDNEKCISRYNENGTEPFPEWIPKTAHRSLVDCLFCQKFCPKNEKLFENITDTVEFSENETVLLSAGEKKENLPRELIDKIDNYNLNWFYSSIPRNLKAMLNNAR
jgi:epoxyqueuosine reductase